MHANRLKTHAASQGQSKAQPAHHEGFRLGIRIRWKRDAPELTPAIENTAPKEGNPPKGRNAKNIEHQVG